MIGGGGIAGLSVRRGVGILVLCKVVVMAVLALPNEDVVVELEAGKFPFLRHEKLWQGDGFWVSWASGGLVLCRC